MLSKKLDLGMYYAIEFFYPFITFLIYLTELRLRMYETLIYPVLPTDSIKTFLKRRYNFSLCKTESVNFPILILRNNFCKNFFFCFGIFLSCILTQLESFKKVPPHQNNKELFCIEGACLLDTIQYFLCKLGTKPHMSYRKSSFFH